MAPTETPAPPTATPEPTQAQAELPAAAWEPVIGAKVADFELLDVDGARHKLSDYAGQAILLNFWATWCPHCRSEMPTFQEVYAARAGEGVVIIAISVGEMADTVAQFAQEGGLTFPVLLDPTGEVGSLYQVSGIPASFFVDRTGAIRGQHVGAITDAAALDQVVDALLQ